MQARHWLIDTCLFFLFHCVLLVWRKTPVRTEHVVFTSIVFYYCIFIVLMDSIKPHAESAQTRDMFRTVLWRTYLIMATHSPDCEKDNEYEDYPLYLADDSS